MLVPALPRVDSAFCQSKTDTAIGKVECIQVARYKATQWATCVSDSYIRQKSKGKHGCLEEKENCLYQCMLEVHGSDSGDISTPCGCSTNATTTSETTAGPSSTKLPSWCSSPTGTECDWYGNCLNPRYRHCGERFATEIVAFAEQFCRLFLNAYSQFASLGVLWLNGVRKCFMVNLVPRLRRWQQADSCEELTTSAITSLSDCFVAPFPGIPSICGVPLAGNVLALEADFAGELATRTRSDDEKHRKLRSVSTGGPRQREGEKSDSPTRLECSNFGQFKKRSQVSKIRTRKVSEDDR